MILALWMYVGACDILIQLYIFGKGERMATEMDWEAKEYENASKGIENAKTKQVVSRFTRHKWKQRANLCFVKNWLRKSFEMSK